ncbi:MAG: hypothetical protein R3F14_21570 [Polyangiaceae bacterium]
MASTFRERRFSPPEVRRILRSAAAIAETSADTGDVEQPLTEGELTRRAAELGLPASAVRRAIGAPSSHGPPPAVPWFRPRTVLLEEEFPGELPAERHEEIVEAIRSEARLPGRTEVIGKTLAWSAGPGVHPLVTVRSKEGRTSLHVQDRLNGAGLLLAFSLLSVFPGLMTGAAVMDISHRPLIAFVSGAVTFLVALVMSTLFVRRTVRRRDAFVHRVQEKVSAAVRGALRKVPDAPAAAGRARIAGAESEAESEGESEKESATVADSLSEANTEAEAEAESAAEAEAEADAVSWGAR